MRYLIFILLLFPLISCQAIVAEAEAEPTKTAVLPTPTPPHYPNLIHQKPIQTHLATDKPATFAYSASAGNTITFTAQPNDNLDLVLELYALDLELLAEADDLPESGAESLTYAFTQSGTYLVRVYEFGGKNGRFRLVAN